ncbi:hypothetical protein Pint_30340 [Pistacia integerrima]|uniref:Uncharacterized protein n=1 Tax=Pistacia integerrima TaxID=434235 RepID=A0ACC0X1J7_9ROSI|nr:hypothetical protein Pint_30340 [Pistacia integerrima]
MENPKSAFGWASKPWIHVRLHNHQGFEKLMVHKNHDSLCRDPRIIWRVETTQQLCSSAKRCPKLHHVIYYVQTATWWEEDVELELSSAWRS